MIKSYVTVCGIFPESTKNTIAKLYLYFVFISLQNYCNISISAMSKVNSMEGLGQIFALRDKHQASKIQNKIVLNSLEYFPLKVFQVIKDIIKGLFFEATDHSF
jgi:hypothetical protein